MEILILFISAFKDLVLFISNVEFVPFYISCLVVVALCSLFFRKGIGKNVY